MTSNQKINPPRCNCDGEHFDSGKCLAGDGVFALSPSYLIARLRRVCAPAGWTLVELCEWAATRLAHETSDAPLGLMYECRDALSLHDQHNELYLRVWKWCRENRSVNTGVGQGADAATAATEPVRRPDSLPSLEQLSDRLADWDRWRNAVRAIGYEHINFQRVLTRRAEAMERLIAAVRALAECPCVSAMANRGG
jgi:hypothetical protein